MADSSGRLDSSSNPHAVHADSTVTKGSALKANETRNDQNIQDISGAFTDPERQEDAGKKRKRDDDDEAPPVPQHRKPDTEWSDEDQIEESPSEQSSYEGGRFKSAAAENNALDYSSVLWPEMHAITTRILEEQKQNQSPNMEKILRGTLEDSCKGPCSESVEFYLSLLRSNCPVPSPSLFDDPALQKILERLQHGYHSKVVLAIGSLLVPPIDHLYAMGETGLENLWESVDEPWSESSPPFDYYPTPAHSVGFQHDAFSIRQRILIGQPAFEEGQFNPYRATPELYFPFLFVEPDFESEHGEWRLNGEERNANSAMVAVRAVVELYTNADRAHEIDRQIVAFSIVYDTLSVAIYGHYAEVGAIEKPESYFRRKIADYKFATPGTQDRWRSYRFVMALYREWAPMHLCRIRSALDSIIGPSNSKTHSPASRSLNDMHPGSSSESLSGQQETQKTPNLMSAQDGGQISPRDPERVDDTISYWCKNQEWPAGHAEASGTTRDAILTSLSRTHTKIADIWSLKIPELEEDPGETVEDSDSELTHSSHSSDARHRFIRNIWTQDFLNHNSRSSGLSKSAEDLVSRLSKTEQQVLPQAADADLEFARIAKRTRWCNFAKMVQDIMPKLVPRVDVLYYAGDDSMECFGESVDEPWRICLSIHKSYRPRPYYAAGLHSDAFTNEQRRILWEMVVERTFENYNSLCWVTQNLYFPFLVVEPVHGSYGDAEDRNTANVLIAMRGTVELFRLARREQEICREILAFSGIFTHSWIRIFAHFADGLEGGETPRFYYHEVFKSMFPEDKWTSFPEDKWASYKFVKNIYKVWAPMHHKRICSAIETVANLSESSS